ncbi:MAG: Hpt domain-containing protein [Sulfurimonadaceae bacterium]|jgi:HPt (histidine-containing phosphotransfer) domain-containing protein|nr:Hpt domain-containing protein [Sulfurimonadaceae bacterium]
MLIYNHKKEFIGIDKHDIEALGCSSFEQILQESTDFADLFVKSPGYIHNFKHVHWIDFITCAESNEDVKVIIHAKGKNYKAIISIETIYLIENPSKQSYIIKLNNLRALTAQENEQISGDILTRPTKQISTYTPPPIEEEEIYAPPKVEVPTTQIPQEEFTAPVIKTAPIEETQNIVLDPYDSDYEELSFNDDDFVQETQETDIVQSFDTQESAQVETTEPSDFENDFKIDLEGFDDDIIETKQPEVVAQEEPKATPPTVASADDHFDYSYVYDPKVASEELGLPIDLIEEFIQDFIAQAHEFNEPLYKSLDANDIDQIRILSHKLKGVAANLRIEDAFNILVTINTSNDINDISLNLNRFYKIIAKLSGEEVQEQIPTPAPTEIQEEFIEESHDDMFDTPLEIQEPVVIPEIEEESFIRPEPKLDLSFEKEEESFEEDLYMDSFEPKESSIDETPDDFIYNPTSTSSQDDLEDFALDLNFKDEIPTPKTQSSYNKTLIANEIGLDQESFDELFQNYIQESTRLLKAFETAIVNEDLPMCKKIALNLKGMSDNMRLSEISKELEAVIGASDIETVNGHVALIKEKLATISNIED